MCREIKHLFMLLTALLTSVAGQVSAMDYTTGVKYMEWDYSEKKLVEKTTFVDSENPDNSTKVYILEKTTPVPDKLSLGEGLEETWYVVKKGKDVSFLRPAELWVDVHIILEDGVKLQLSDDSYSSSAVTIPNFRLYIHGQGEGTGEVEIKTTYSTLTATSREGHAGIYNEGTGGGIYLMGGVVTIKSQGEGIIGNTYVYGGQLSIKSANSYATSTPYPTNMYGIYLPTYTDFKVYGGKVDVTSKGRSAIYSESPNNTIEIYDGNVTFTGEALDDSSTGTNVPYGIQGGSLGVYGGKLTVLDDVPEPPSSSCYPVKVDALRMEGGQVQIKYDSPAYSGDLATLSVSDLYFGWTNPTDYFYTYKIRFGSSVTNANLEPGKLFADLKTPETIYQGTISNLNGFRNLMVVPVLNVNYYDLHYHDWCRFDAAFILPSTVKAYYPVGVTFEGGSAKVVLSSTALNGLAAARPAILTSENEESILPYELNLVATNDYYTSIQSYYQNTPSKYAADYDGRTDRLPGFVAGDGKKTMEDLIIAVDGSSSWVDLNDYMAFVLTNDVFRPVTFTAGTTPAKGQCLLILPKWNVMKHINIGSVPPGARTIGIDFGEGETTSLTPSPGLTPNPSPKGEGSEYWYDLQGRKLSDGQMTKGVYIYKGKKVVLK